MNCLKTLIYLLFFGYISCYHIKPGPKIIATKGEVWPKPQKQDRYQGYFAIKPQNFSFTASEQKCEILQDAFDRYSKIINTALGVNRRNKRKRNQYFSRISSQIRDDPNFVGYLTNLNVKLSKACGDNDIPDTNMNENYSLSINENNSKVAVLYSDSIWGALRGLETFSQLLYPNQDKTELLVNSTIISDFPRFMHRGFLLDTSRHFMPMSIILQIIDAMSYNKLNIFHWHIVDDQSFPYQSKSFPQLSDKGAYHKSMIYTPQDVQKVIKYAAKRGIRVMAEFDTPGHTRSWGEALPELLTTCYTKGKPDGYLGPMNPIKNTTYSFLKTFFKEVVDTFPEQYVHLGGDEVDFDCWQGNPDIQKWMDEHNLEDYAKLEEYYIQKLVDIVDGLKASSVVWEEVFTNGVRLPKKTIVHAWIGLDVVPKSTKKGYRTIWSSCWYLDHLETGGDWEKYYKCDPHASFHLTPEQEQLVIGGEACMWAETVDATNVVQRIWPRASAAAEKLWSARTVTNLADARQRLEEHTCRMNIRGIPAQPPNGPGFCIV